MKLLFTPALPLLLLSLHAVCRPIDTTPSPPRAGHGSQPIRTELAQSSSSSSSPARSGFSLPQQSPSTPPSESSTNSEGWVAAGFNFHDAGATDPLTGEVHLSQSPNPMATSGGYDSVALSASGSESVPRAESPHSSLPSSPPVASSSRPNTGGFPHHGDGPIRAGMRRKRTPPRSPSPPPSSWGDSSPVPSNGSGFQDGSGNEPTQIAGPSREAKGKMKAVGSDDEVPSSPQHGNEGGSNGRASRSSNPREATPDFDSEAEDRKRKAGSDLDQDRRRGSKRRRE